MFCAKCGNVLPEKAVFCEKCGQRVKIPGDNNMKISGGSNKRQAKPVPRIIIALVLETMVLAALLFVAYTKIKEYASPETVAKSYFIAAMAGDVKEAYDYIDVDESEFVNEDYFGKLLEDIGNRNVYNYKVDNMDESETDEEGGRGFHKTVVITYRLKEDTTDYVFYVELDKSSSKKYFVFDDWKVNIGDYIRKDVEIYAKQGSKVMIDGKELSQEYIAETAEENDRFVIPKMFFGTYEALITHDMFTDYKMSLSIDDDGTYYYDDYDYEDEDEGEGYKVMAKPEIVEKTRQQAQEDFKALWDSAVQQKAFDSVTDVRTIKDNTVIKEEYEELTQKFGQEDGVGLQQITFGEFKVAAKSGIGDISEYPCIRVSFSAPFTCVSLSKDWWYGTVESSNDSGDYSGTMVYTYLNGEWVLSDISIAEIYY